MDNLSAPPPVEPPPGDQTSASQGPISRRKWLRRSTAAAVTAGIGTAGYAWRIEPHWVEYVHRPMPIAGLPPELAGKTLVQLSDLHIGQTVNDDYLIRSFQAVDLLKPDFVVVTGDFISYYGQRSWPQAENVLKHIPHGRLATLGCLGNHDYGHGWRQNAIATNMTALAQDCGIEVLRNDRLNVVGLSIIGLEDYWGTRWHNKAASEATETAGPSIVLCHNPDVCDLPVWSNFQGWILSGHTHGGQCRLPFLRPPILPVQNRRYTAGEFDLGDGRRLYINRALGYLRRIRFCVRPEVTVFTLQPA